MPGNSLLLPASKLKTESLSFICLFQYFLPVYDALSVVVQFGFPHHPQPVEIAQFVEKYSPASISPTILIINKTSINVAPHQSPHLSPGSSEAVWSTLSRTCNIWGSLLFWLVSKSGSGSDCLLLNVCLASLNLLSMLTSSPVFCRTLFGHPVTSRELMWTLWMVIIFYLINYSNNVDMSVFGRLHSF